MNNKTIMEKLDKILDLTSELKEMIDKPVLKVDDIPISSDDDSLRRQPEPLSTDPY